MSTSKSVSTSQSRDFPSVQLFDLGVLAVKVSSFRKMPEFSPNMETALNSIPHFAHAKAASSPSPTSPASTKTSANPSP
jgi:hypothetical protein